MSGIYNQDRLNNTVLTACFLWSTIMTIRFLSQDYTGYRFLTNMIQDFGTVFRKEFGRVGDCLWKQTYC
jgi:hypothetical protein